MWPAVREGDLLLCEPLGTTAPMAGEVLVANEGPGWVAHRLRCARRRRGEEQLILKADLGRPDRPRRREEILGRVLLVYRQEDGLTEVTTTLAGDELEISPFLAALLRHIARWHTRASNHRNARRNRHDRPLQSVNVSPARPPDPGDLARTRPAPDGGLRHAHLPRGA